MTLLGFCIPKMPKGLCIPLTILSGFVEAFLEGHMEASVNCIIISCVLFAYCRILLEFPASHKNGCQIHIPRVTLCLCLFCLYLFLCLSLCEHVCVCLCVCVYDILILYPPPPPRLWENVSCDSLFIFHYFSFSVFSVCFQASILPLWEWLYDRC